MTQNNHPDGGGTLDDLRAALFATLRGLRDKDDPMPMEQATATVHVAQALIATGRLEIEYLKLSTPDVEGHKSAFLASLVDPMAPKSTPQITQRQTASGQETAQPSAGGRILQHRMR